MPEGLGGGVGGKPACITPGVGRAWPATPSPCAGAEPPETGPPTPPPADPWLPLPQRTRPSIRSQASAAGPSISPLSPSIYPSAPPTWWLGTGTHPSSLPSFLAWVPDTPLPRAPTGLPHIWSPQGLFPRSPGPCPPHSTQPGNVSLVQPQWFQSWTLRGSPYCIFFNVPKDGFICLETPQQPGWFLLLSSASPATLTEHQGSPSKAALRTAPPSLPLAPLSKSLLVP